MRPEYDQPSKPQTRQEIIKLLLPCTKEQVDEREIEIENIEVDPQGRDVVSFRCPYCAEIHKSHRRR
jgi:hypothetical protein